MYLSSFNKNVNLTLIRHGTTKFNEEDRVQGSSDIPLSNKGIEDIDLINLENTNFDLFYHSPLIRSKDTLYGILEKYNIDIDNSNIKQDILITERKYGIFEGLTKKEIKNKYPNLYNEWLKNENIKGEGIETIENVIDRIKLFISKVISFDFKNILLVTHSGFLYALYKYITNEELNLKPEELDVRFPNCCISKLNIEIDGNKIVMKLVIDEKVFIRRIEF
tara:strand:- start:853 stop:1515 length:663 start_codon:yes stop_codon:yes gene_type:complete